MKIHSKKQGFTLVELMVAMVATAILVLIMSLILIMPIRVMRTNNEYARIRRDMAFAVQMLTRDIRHASFNEVVTDEVNLLTLSEDDPSDPFDPADPDASEYRRSPEGVLTRYVGGSDQGMVIIKGLQRFNPVGTNDVLSGLQGVVLNLEMGSDTSDIVVAHKTFIHTRN